MKISILLTTTAVVMFLANQLTNAAQVVGWGYRIGDLESRFAQKGFSPDGFLLNADDQPLTNVTSVTVGFSQCLALRDDGVVVGWGGMGYIVPVEKSDTWKRLPDMAGIIRVNDEVLDEVQAVSAGDGICMALKRNGTVVVWGDDFADATKIPADLRNVVAIAAGFHRCLALQSNGLLVCWGYGNIPFPPLTNVIAIAAGKAEYSHDLVLSKDGTVVEWKSGRSFQGTKILTGLSNVVAIAAGRNSNLALKNDGTIVEWPLNYERNLFESLKIEGQILKDIKAVAAGYNYNLALRKNGTVIGWGGNRAQLINMPAGLSSVVAIAAGESFCLAITTNTIADSKFPR